VLEHCYALTSTASAPPWASGIERRCGPAIGFLAGADHRDHSLRCPALDCPRLQVPESSYRRVAVCAGRVLPVEWLLLAVLVAMVFPDHMLRALLQRMSRREDVSRVRRAAWHVPSRPSLVQRLLTATRAPGDLLTDRAFPPNPAGRPRGDVCRAYVRQPTQTRTRLLWDAPLPSVTDHAPAHLVRRPRGDVCRAYQPIVRHPRSPERRR
jgi:hypothetical protein